MFRVIYRVQISAMYKSAKPEFLIAQKLHRYLIWTARGKPGPS